MFWKKAFFTNGLSWIVNSVGRSKAFNRLDREFEFGFVSESSLESSLVTSMGELDWFNDGNSQESRNLFNQDKVQVNKFVELSKVKIYSYS